MITIIKFIFPTLYYHNLNHLYLFLKTINYLYHLLVFVSIYFRSTSLILQSPDFDTMNQLFISGDLPVFKPSDY